MTDALKKLFERDLEKLEQEVKAYSDSINLWRPLPGTLNPAGNLCLHICGNLRHFIGAVLGTSGYIRERSTEFTQNGLPPEDLVLLIRNTGNEIMPVLSELTNEKLNEPYPLLVFGKPMSTGYFLMHLYGHFNYHLGQINYHRRFVAVQ